MKEVAYAEIVRFTERNDIRCADIEVKLEGSSETYLAEFTASGDHLEMSHIYKKDVSTEIDWYDNNLHDAYVDVSEQLFGRKASIAKGNEREDFKEQVLTFGSVKKELEDHFKMMRKASVFGTEDADSQELLH
ncbi:hypothetical protein [Paenibacillus hexagrammi]|uniref:Uncharacterized protein n=1 Tax=Paenibacillus hexagrammi TaxID=2908839 RepID=A0ABY3SCE2_9BACL|nr:hypothetical protein [Paenibacillus sp. YPD9-1]UJF31668.1 hypothetical protein L0M14_17980 [Paenibacillus sp. YPD9-1]